MKNNYWYSNLKILSILLTVWFIVSFGFGIILSDFLDQFQIGGFKLGFWFAQQGSIYFFVLLIFIYIYFMNKLDKKYKDNPEEDL
jgi:putative solute:sodium symporter small subunit